MIKDQELLDERTDIETLGTSAGACSAAVLDAAHIGDIHGAVGTIKQHSVPPPSRPWGRRIMALLAIVGPGLIVVTEFIGVSLAMSYFRVSPLICVPVSALALVAMTVTGSFRRWERSCTSSSPSISS